MGLVLPQEGSECKISPTSIYQFYVNMTQKFPALLFFSGRELRKVVYLFVNAYLHLWWCKSKACNKPPIWMDDIPFMDYRDAGAIISGDGWSRASDEVIRRAPNHRNRFTSAEATAHPRSSCFWGKQRQLQSGTGRLPPVRYGVLPTVGFGQHLHWKNHYTCPLPTTQTKTIVSLWFFFFFMKGGK